MEANSRFVIAESAPIFQLPPAFPVNFTAPRMCAPAGTSANPPAGRP